MIRQSATATLNAGAMRVGGSSSNLSSIDLAGPVNLTGGVTAEATRGAINFNGPSHVIGGVIELDVASNNRINTINFNSGTGSSGSILLSSVSSSTSQLTATANLVFAQGVTHTTGDITLRTARTSTTTSGTNFHRAALTLDIAGNVTGANMLIRHDEGAAGKNQSTARVNITGSLAVNRILQQAMLGGGTNAVFVAPNAVGSVVIDLPGTLQIKPNGGTNATSALAKLPNFAASGTSTGTLDITNNAIVFTNEAVANVRSALIAGYAGGAWNGTGIASTTAASTPNRTIGYAEAGSLLGITGTQTASFQGLAVDPDDVLVRYTVNGDLNLDGQVAFTDLLTVSANFGVNNGTQDYQHGDTNFDGSVTFVDLLAVAANFGGMLPASIPGASEEFNDALAAVASQVPEPATLGALVLAGGAMLMRRRRQK